MRRRYCSFLPKAKRFWQFEGYGVSSFKRSGKATPVVANYNYTEIFLDRNCRTKKFTLKQVGLASVLKMEGTHKTEIRPAGGENRVDFIAGSKMAANQGGNPGLAA